jgi:hypothetical protein
LRCAPLGRDNRQSPFGGYPGVEQPESRQCSARSGLNNKKGRESRPFAVPSATRAIVTSGSSSPDPRSLSATSACRCAWTSSPIAHDELGQASRGRKRRSQRSRRGRRGYGAHFVVCRLLSRRRCWWRIGVSSAGRAYRPWRPPLSQPGTLRRSQGLCSEAAQPCVAPDERRRQAARPSQVNAVLIRHEWPRRSKASILIQCAASTL